MSLPRMCEIESPLHRELTVTSAWTPAPAQPQFRYQQATASRLSNSAPSLSYQRDNIEARNTVINLVQGKSMLSKVQTTYAETMMAEYTKEQDSEDPLTKPDFNRPSSKSVKFTNPEDGTNKDFNVGVQQAKKATIKPSTVTLCMEEPCPSQDQERPGVRTQRSTVTRSAPLPSAMQRLDGLSKLQDNEIPVKFRIYSSRTSNIAMDRPYQTEKDRYQAKRKQRLLLSTSANSNFALLLREAVKPPVYNYKTLAIPSLKSTPQDKQKVGRGAVWTRDKHHGVSDMGMSVPTLRMDNEESSFTHYVRLNKAAARRLDNNSVNPYGGTYM